MQADESDGLNDSTIDLDGVNDKDRRMTWLVIQMALTQRQTIIDDMDNIDGINNIEDNIDIDNIGQMDNITIMLITFLIADVDDIDRGRCNIFQTCVH